jgi:hypothetical protein
MVCAVVPAEPGCSRLPPAPTRCAVTSGIRGAFSDAIRSSIRRPTAAMSSASADARTSSGRLRGSSRDILAVCSLDTGGGIAFSLWG